MFRLSVFVKNKRKLMISLTFTRHINNGKKKHLIIKYKTQIKDPIKEKGSTTKHFCTHTYICMRHVML